MGEQKKRKKKKIKIRHDGTTGGKGPSHRRDLRPQTKSSAHWLGHAEASVYTSRPKSHPQMRGIFTSWTKGESARDSFLIKAVNFCILALVCCDVPLPALEPKQKDPSTRRSASDCPLGHHQSDGAFSSSSGIKGLWFRRSNIMIADSHTITRSHDHRKARVISRHLLFGPKKHADKNRDGWLFPVRNLPHLINNGNSSITPPPLDQGRRSPAAGLLLSRSALLALAKKTKGALG